jgi:hypothetical protein
MADRQKNGAFSMLQKKGAFSMLPKKRRIFDLRSYVL